ncbi:MAG TPA: serine hydrolase domain-containing protein, partial [Holophagaceae bacterium]
MNAFSPLGLLAVPFAPQIYRSAVRRRIQALPLRDPVETLDRVTRLLVRSRLASAAAWSFASPEGASHGAVGFDSGGGQAGAGTLFEAGSLTKVFTGLLLADAAGASMLGLEDPIRMALPEGAVLLPGGWELTWKQLATHTSGLPRLPYGFGIRQRLSRDPYAAFGSEAMARSLRQAPRTGPPVRGYLYSNFGFALLGHLLAQVHQRPLATLFRERIFEPLGLPDTTCGAPGGGSAAQGRNAIGLPARRWSHQGATLGAGGLDTTIGDLATFLAWNLEAARGGTSRLGPALRSAQEVRVRGAADGVGLGWHLRFHRNGMVHWHDGMTGAFSSFMGFS